MVAGQTKRITLRRNNEQTKNLAKMILTPSALDISLLQTIKGYGYLLLTDEGRRVAYFPLKTELKQSDYAYYYSTYPFVYDRLLRSKTTSKHRLDFLGD